MGSGVVTVNGKASTRELLVELDPKPLYVWDRHYQETATQTARIEDAKAAQARADAAREVYLREEEQLRLGAAAAEKRAQQYNRAQSEAQHKRLLARQQQAQTEALVGAGAASTVTSIAWDNLRLRSSLVRRERAAVKSKRQSHAARRKSLRREPQSHTPDSRQTKAEIVEQLAQEIESRVRPEATVEWALRAPLPTADQWRPPRSYITKEGTDGDPFVWVAARKASAAPLMCNRQSQRSSMSAEEKRDRREVGLTRGRHRACMEELLRLKRRATRFAFWARTSAPFSMSGKKNVSDDAQTVDREFMESTSETVSASSGMNQAAAASRPGINAATTPFSAPEGGEAALEVRARTAVAKRTRQRHRHMGKESWRKYADLGTADVDARGRCVSGCSQIYIERLQGAKNVDNSNATTHAETILWQDRQTSSMLFQCRERLHCRDTSADPAETGICPVSRDVKEPAQQQDNREDELALEQGADSSGLDGLYALAPDSVSQLRGRPTAWTDDSASAVDSSEDLGIVTQGLRSLLADITQMELQNRSAAQRNCSSTAPRMQLTPREQRVREASDRPSIRDQPRDAPSGVWNQERSCRRHQSTNALNGVTQADVASIGPGPTTRHLQDERALSRRSHRLRSTQRVRTPPEKQMLASRAAAAMAAQVCG